MEPIQFWDIPTDRKLVYWKNVCDIRPEKAETHRSRIVIRGNQFEYPDTVHTTITNMTAANILFNSIISTKKGKDMGIDIKSYYLNTLMDHPE